MKYNKLVIRLTTSRLGVLYDLLNIDCFAGQLLFRIKGEQFNERYHSLFLRAGKTKTALRRRKETLLMIISEKVDVEKSHFRTMRKKEFSKKPKFSVSRS